MEDKRQESVSQIMRERDASERVYRKAIEDIYDNAKKMSEKMYKAVKRPNFD